MILIEHDATPVFQLLGRYRPAGSVNRLRPGITVRKRVQFPVHLAHGRTQQGYVDFVDRTDSSTGGNARHSGPTCVRERVCLRVGEGDAAELWHGSATSLQTLDPTKR
jgi:hypothetical protein